MNNNSDKSDNSDKLNESSDFIDMYCEKLSFTEWPNIDNCMMLTILGTILYSNYKIISQGMIDTLDYTFDFEKYFENFGTSNEYIINVTHKETKKTTQHGAFPLGFYMTDEKKWVWFNIVNELCKDSLKKFLSLDKDTTLIGMNSTVIDFYNDLFTPSIKMHFESQHIIPHLMQVVFPKGRLVKCLSDMVPETNQTQLHTYILVTGLPQIKFDYQSLLNEFETFRKVTDNLDKLPDRLKKNPVFARTVKTKRDVQLAKLRDMIKDFFEERNFGRSNERTENGIYIKSSKFNIEKNYPVTTKLEDYGFKTESLRKLSREKSKTTKSIFSREKVRTKVRDNGKNSELIKWFELLVKQLEFYVDVKTGKDKLMYSYKLNSIKKALKVIAKIDFKITDGEQLRKYKGIGDGTIKRINEILETGQLSEVNEADISGKHLDYVEELMKIFGIGRVKAYELYTKHGIKSISDLKKAIKNKTVELPENITKGIHYVDKIKTKIPRSEIDDIYSLLITTGIKLDPEMDVRVCGSYRREKDFSNDIDLIISHPYIITKKQAEDSNLMKDFIQALIMQGFIIDSLTSLDVPTKYMGICKLDSKHEMRRIDIRYIPQESYYTAILYFTGSAEFNTRMRAVALTMGYTLNEYRLLDNKSKPFKVTSEKDVFNYLNMEYLVPKDRI